MVHNIVKGYNIINTKKCVLQIPQMLNGKLIKWCFENVRN